MEDKLIGLLQNFGYPVRRQGSMTQDEKYPDTFFTFWNNDEDEDKSYDNETISVLYDYNVYVYSSDPDKAFGLLREARTLLKNNKFIIATRGFDVASDEPTHIGRGMNILYKNYEN